MKKPLVTKFELAVVILALVLTSFSYRTATGATVFDDTAQFLTDAFDSVASVSEEPAPTQSVETQYATIESVTVSSSGRSWREDFDGTVLNMSFWNVSNKQAPGYSAGNHIGYFQPNRVSLVSGYLKINLTQEKGAVDGNPNGVISRGGEIRSLNRSGYGTYEWRMRFSSSASSPAAAGVPVNGSVSAGFIYTNNSLTEIGFEVESQWPRNVYMYNWYNADPKTDPIISERTLTTGRMDGLYSTFKTYKFVWSQGRLEYYIDSVLWANHTTNVPWYNAFFYVNHYGMNSTDTGGYANLTAARYMYVDWVRYTAQGETPVPQPGTDTQPPSVSITSPANNSQVSGVINVTANALDNVGVAGVQFKRDGINLGAEDTTSPYNISWNTSTATLGKHNLTAVARDAAGNSATSAPVVVTVVEVTQPPVSGDTIKPYVLITMPTNGAYVSARQRIDATATDNVAVAKVEFYIDGVYLASDTKPPYRMYWNTKYTAPGSHTIRAVAYDASGNYASHQITVYK